MRTAETAKTEHWIKSAPLSGLLSGLFSLLVLQLKIKMFSLPPFQLLVLLQVRVTAAVVNICRTVMSILIIFIIIIVLLEASVSLVLAKINVITFKGKESIGSGKKINSYHIPNRSSSKRCWAQECAQRL